MNERWGREEEMKESVIVTARQNKNILPLYDKRIIIIWYYVGERIIIINSHGIVLFFLHPRPFINNFSITLLCLPPPAYLRLNVLWEISSFSILSRRTAYKRRTRTEREREKKKKQTFIWTDARVITVNDSCRFLRGYRQKEGGGKKKNVLYFPRYTQQTSESTQSFSINSFIRANLRLFFFSQRWNYTLSADNSYLVWPFFSLLLGEHVESGTPRCLVVAARKREKKFMSPFENVTLRAEVRSNVKLQSGLIQRRARQIIIAKISRLITLYGWIFCLFLTSEFINNPLNLNVLFSKRSKLFVIVFLNVTSVSYIIYVHKYIRVPYNPKAVYE